MPGQIPRPYHILAEAASRARHRGGLQEEGLSRLHRKLGAAAVAQGEAVGALHI